MRNGIKRFCEIQKCSLDYIVRASTLQTDSMKNNEASAVEIPNKKPKIEADS